MVEIIQRILSLTFTLTETINNIMDTSAAALMHDIGEILNDFRANMIYSYEEHQDEIEEKVNDLEREIKGLFNSSYSFNK